MFGSPPDQPGTRARRTLALDQGASLGRRCSAAQHMPSPISAHRTMFGHETNGARGGPEMTAGGSRPPDPRGTWPAGAQWGAPVPGDRRALLTRP